MFNKFKELFSSENLLDIAFNTTLTMLDFDYKMYDASRGSLRESDNAELPFDVRDLRCVQYALKPRPLHAGIYKQELIAHLRSLESQGWLVEPLLARLQSALIFADL